MNNRAFFSGKFPGNLHHFDYFQARGKNVFDQSEHLFTFWISANQIRQNCFGQEKTRNFIHKYRVVNNGPGRQMFSIIGLIIDNLD